MPPRRPAVPLALAALAGAALGSLAPLPLLVVLAAAAPAAGVVTLAARRRRRVATPAAAALLVAGTAGLAGAWASWTDARRDHLRPDAPPWPPDRPVRLRGTLAGAPYAVGPGRVGLLVASGPDDARVLVEAPARCVQGALAPGARVEALGRFAPATPPAVPGGFDRREALRRQGAAARLVAVDVRAVPGDARPGAFLAALVAHAGRVIDAGARPRHAAFLRAVILGERGRVDRAALEAFRRTGTAHLLSISGLHVTVLAGLVLALARALGLRRLEQAVVVIACVALYVTVAGAAVPILRAATAGVVGVTLVGRGDAWNRLAVGLLAVLAVEPRAALEVGTALSFGTVAGLLLLDPLARRALRRPDPLGRARPRSRMAPLAERAAQVAPASLAAFMASVPLIAVTLGQLPLGSLLLNPPCIALFTVALGLGVAGVLVGAVGLGPGSWLVALADVPTGWIYALVEGGAALPEAPVVPPAPGVAVAAFGALGLGVVRREARRGGRALLLVGAALLAGLTLPRPGRGEGAALAPPRARPGFAAVVQGAAIVVGSPDGAVGLGAPPSSRARLTAALDRACGTRRVRWTATDEAPPGRLAGARVVRLAPGLARVDLAAGALLVATHELRALPPGPPPRADVVLAPRARPALAAELVARSGARRALVAAGCDLPPGVERLSPAPDGGLPLP